MGVGGQGPESEVLGEEGMGQQASWGLWLAGHWAKLLSKKLQAYRGTRMLMGQ